MTDIVDMAYEAMSVENGYITPTIEGITPIAAYGLPVEGVKVLALYINVYAVVVLPEAPVAIGF